MNLKTYISSFEKSQRNSERRRLAEHLSVSVNAIYAWESGIRHMHPKHFQKMIEATKGKVTHFRSDVDLKLNDKNRLS